MNVTVAVPHLGAAPFYIHIVCMALIYIARLVEAILIFFYFRHFLELKPSGTVVGLLVEWCHSRVIMPAFKNF